MVFTIGQGIDKTVQVMFRASHTTGSWSVVKEYQRRRSYTLHYCPTDELALPHAGIISKCWHLKILVIGTFLIVVSGDSARSEGRCVMITNFSGTILNLASSSSISLRSSSSALATLATMAKDFHYNHDLVQTSE